jgi:hypothetical protein
MSLNNLPSELVMLAVVWGGSIIAEGAERDSLLRTNVSVPCRSKPSTLRGW